MRTWGTPRRGASRPQATTSPPYTVRAWGGVGRRPITCCRDEERCLVTLDAEFANPLLYPPGKFRGIVLLRVPPPTDAAILATVLDTLAEAPRADPSSMPGPDRGLWVVQTGRVRVYQPRNEA